MLLARQYTGNYDIISLDHGYHGTTVPSMGISSLNIRKQPIPIGFGTHSIMNPDPYKGIWGGSKCRDSPVQADRKCDCKPNQCYACDQYLAQSEDVLNYCVPKHGLAGIITESIQRGGICVSDEVQTGFGRTGEHFWGFQGHDVVPDIVIMAKGIANGYPMGAVVTTTEIQKRLSETTYFSTFGGNPLGCNVASAVLDIIDEEQLQQNSLQVGTHFLHGLAELSDKFPIVGDVRGMGLMIGLELVENNETKKPLSADRMTTLFEKIKDKGVLIGRGGLFFNVLRMKPPMCINKKDVDFALDVFEDVFKEIV